MSLHHFKRVSALLLIVGSIAGSWQLYAAATPSKAFMENMGLSEYTTITYLSGDGAEISSEQFFKLAFSGRAFLTEKNPDTHEAVLAIRPIADAARVTQQAGLSIGIGKTMPKAALSDLSGRSRSLYPGDGKPLLISFFFSECAPCVQEVQDLNAFARSNPGIDVVAVTFDSALDSKAFVDKYGLAWPVVAEAQSYIDTVGVKTYPGLALVAPTGVLVAHRSGGLSSFGGAKSGDAALAGWVASSLRED
ncbi:MAG: TlpA family protein disulfide reductase [Xanthomonadales bacterium]|nr:TlpA family protein disulfide reductase [Xanthomonadales bacterium]